jgi:fatty acid-binding protein DegV
MITDLAFSRSRSDKLLMKKLVPGRIQEYGVVHANDPARAQQVAQGIQSKLGMAPRFICEISSIVALFAGESAYAVAFIEKAPDQGSAA